MTKMLGLNLSFINDDTCLIHPRTNTTVINNIYQGITETLLLNFVSWLLLILLFAILRKRAWDYGRQSLVPTEKWTHLFYKILDDDVHNDESNDDIADQGCQWFRSVFKITREEIIIRCGPDVSYYLSFQTQLILSMFVISLFSLFVILPLNFQGMLLGDKITFGHTTIGNLEADSNLLWVHIAGSICVAPLIVFLMSKCSGGTPQTTALSSKTIMITNILKIFRNIDDIRRYLTTYYPQIEIENIKLAYKVKKLCNLVEKRNKVQEAREYCLHHLQRSDIEIKIQPYGSLFCCPCGTQNSMEYYTREEERLNTLIILERAKALTNPLGIAFVTFSTQNMAQYVLNNFESKFHKNWIIFKAPSASDINWENLEISHENSFSKIIIINALLLIILFFVTTPIIMIEIIDSLTGQENAIEKLSPVLSTLFLLSMSALMPLIVAFSDEWMSHWTKSKQNHVTMYKIFFFLLFMILILPSLGLTNAQEFAKSFVHPKNITVRWECIFLADKGAFFVNYVISSALIGTALELLRFPELAMYTWRWLRMKSEAEQTSIRKKILSIFPFGIHYAWTLLVFTVSTVYSFTCPLITPFGLLYLCLKYLVDKYNIYYVYKPITMSGEGQKIHYDAIRMVRIAVLLLQIVTAAFFILRKQIIPQGLVALLGLVVTSFYFLFTTFKTIESSPDAIDTCEDYEAPDFTILNTCEDYEAPVFTILMAEFSNVC